MHHGTTLAIAACLAAGCTAATFNPIEPGALVSAPLVSAPLVIAHRGASGYLPEHTLEAYRLAIEQGADYIEPDLVATRDGVLVARHEPDISDTTDVSSRLEFAARRTTRVIDGVTYNGWFTTDFTLVELRTLRARQARAERPQQFNGQFLIPTLDEIIALAQAESTRLGRSIGIYPETKHPTWHCEQGLPLEPALLSALKSADWTTRTAPVFIQSFESGNLRYLRQRTGVRLIQLLDAGGIRPDGALDRPLRWEATGRCQLYDAPPLPGNFAERAGFDAIAAYADGVGPWKRHIVSVATDGRLLPPTRFIELAHAAGLLVHAWTFRNEATMLAPDYEGDPLREYAQFYALGLDAVFSDFPDTAIAARASFMRAPPGADTTPQNAGK